MRRDILAKDVANREHLYSEFLKEVGNLYFDSVNRTLFETSDPVASMKKFILDVHPNEALSATNRGWFALR